MKTQSATIHLVLRKSRPKADGTYPIVLSVQWGGRKEKYLGISCLPNQWNERDEELKKNCPNYAQLNIQLKTAKQKVVDFKLACENDNKPYSAEMLLGVLDGQVKNPKSLRLVDLVERHCSYPKELSKNTKLSYQTLINNLSRYTGGKDLLITQLDEKFCRDYAQWLKTKNEIKGGKVGAKDRTIIGEMKHIASIWNFAISEDLVDVKNYPFRKFKPQKEYKFEDRKQCLNPYQLKALENLYIVLCEEYGVCDMFGIEKRDNPTIGVSAKWDSADNEFYFDALNWWDDIVSDGGMEERRKFIYELGQTQKKLYKMHLIFGGINFCLLVFYMQGLAPVDVCKLRAKQVCIKTHTNGREYYHVEGVKRSKTGEPVPISCIRTKLTDLLFLPHFYNADGELKNGEDWFITNGKGEYTNSNDLTKQLQKVWAFINGTYQRLFRDSIKMKQKVGNKKYYWVDIPQDITAYCFRHTFASIYYYNGGTLRDLALLMGRDEEYIFNYIHSLVSYDEILEDKENIMGTFEESPVKGIEEFF